MSNFGLKKYLIHRHIKDIKSAEKPLRAILLNFDGVFLPSITGLLAYLQFQE